MYSPLARWALLACALLSQATLVRSETITVDAQPVTILRDHYGVPHVFAATQRGLFFGNGYAVAQDRLGQMEFYRRSARGEMAEILGETGLAADRETRIDGCTEAERLAQFHRLPAGQQAALQAYADGVNAWREKAIASGHLPARLVAIGDTPGPWRVTDSIAIAIDMARRFGGDRGGELRNLLLLRYLQTRDPAHAWALFNDLTWKNDPAAPVTLPDAAGRPANPPARFPAHAVNDAMFGVKSAHLSTGALTRALAQVSMAARLHLAERYHLPTRLGSYCLAVAASKSATGNALLVGGPQMGWMTPQIAHEIHLSGAGIDCIGMGFAGLPGILIGHNPYLAWTTTTGDADLTDIFAEKTNPQNPHQYWYKGRWRDMAHRVETIAVKGGDPVSLDVYATIHGPVVQEDKANHLAYSRMASYRNQEAGAFSAIFQFETARTAQQFLDAAAQIKTSHNWFCATQSGDIAWRFSGLAPIRASNIDPRLPTPGTGEYDWRGFIPPAQMPHAIDPPQGFFANWNTKPVPEWNNADTPTWGAVWHSSRIADLLRAKNKLTTEDLRLILIDIGTNDIDAQHFVPLLLSAAKSGAAYPGPLARQALAYLGAWDFHAREGSVAKTLFDAWFQQLRDDLFLQTFGDFGDRGLFNKAMQPSFMLHVLLGRHSSVRVRYDYLAGRSADGVMLAALDTSVQSLAKARGPLMANWRYHVGTFNLAPLPGIPAYDRGTYIEIVECGKPEVTGVSILAPGQSEDPQSPHFGDQREMAGWWFFKRMLTRRSEIEASRQAPNSAGRP